MRHTAAQDKNGAGVFASSDAKPISLHAERGVRPIG
jgi:hypothetical protein